MRKMQNKTLNNHNYLQFVFTIVRITINNDHKFTATLIISLWQISLQIKLKFWKIKQKLIYF